MSGSYSISMLLRYDPMDTDYARLIDFSNSTADDGIYKLDGGVSFYPVGEFAAGSMGPKVRAAIEFVEGGRGRAAIGDLDEAVAVLEGAAGTTIVPT